MSSNQKDLKKSVKKIANKFIGLFLEEEEEHISDSGLDHVEVSVERKENKPVQENHEVINNIEEVQKNTETETEIKEEVKIEEDRSRIEEFKIKTKKPFAKVKQKTLEEELFETEEKNTIMEIMKGSVMPEIEIVESKDVENIDYEKADINIDNATDELTDEQKEEKIFYDKLNMVQNTIDLIKRDDLFSTTVGQLFDDTFEAIFFALMEAINENDMLTKVQKCIRMNKMKDAILILEEGDIVGICEYFKMIRHELHKAENNLGLYSREVKENKNLQVDSVLEYKIAEIYEDESKMHLLLESDKVLFEELASYVRAMDEELENKKSLNVMKITNLQEENIRRIRTTNNICDVLIEIESFKHDLYKIKNGLDEFSKTSLAF